MDWFHLNFFGYPIHLYYVVPFQNDHCSWDNILNPAELFIFITFHNHFKILKMRGSFQVFIQNNIHWVELSYELPFHFQIEKEKNKIKM